MMPGGSLAPTFGWLVGTGPGAGMALVFVFMGLLGTLPGLVGYAFDAVRNIEDIIPDHDADARIKPGQVQNSRRGARMG